MSDPPLPTKEPDVGRMVSIRLDADLARALDEHVAMSGQSQSDFVRSALVGYFAMYDTAVRSYLSRSLATPERIVWWRRLIGL